GGKHTGFHTDTGIGIGATIATHGDWVPLFMAFVSISVRYGAVVGMPSRQRALPDASNLASAWLMA
ncbi:hypothetical protein, partial [Pseudoalteromonas sp. SIMBA_162]|uniref:hypothetical protein n=1 Tax=Pseudoalteromonas sp. SIMBA_162 TaxID=3080867 RepID=UPI00397C7225